MIPVVLGLLIISVVYSLLLVGSFLIQKFFPRWFLFEYYSWFGRFVMNPLMLATILSMIAATIFFIILMAEVIGLSVMRGLS